MDGDVIEIKADSYHTIRDSVSPYIHHRSNKDFYFTLMYVTHDKVIPFLQQLNRASQLHSSEHQTMIAMIAHHRQSLYPFKTMFFDDLYERECGNFVVEMIEPLVNIPGRVVVSESRLYFQPFSNAFSLADVLKWKLDAIKQLICRTYLLLEVGLEIFLRDEKRPHYFFVFDSVENRNKFYDTLCQFCSSSLEESNQSNMTLKWQSGVISNYEYLVYLNNISDRTLNNLSQYPIFPWVLTNYTDKELDLEDVSNYRDLSKPVGALNEKRLQSILLRYQDMPEPKFMYGSHYSTPGFVTYYLMRSHPDLMLCLMGGKFDHPDRVFAGIEESWQNVLTNSSDFKELIPQFYGGDGSFLENKLRLNFGRRQNGDVVDNVKLPPWAANPKDFISKMREALESDYVSANLHHWIDLIFGFKQQGSYADKSYNVFHYLCYPGSINLDEIVDPNEKTSVITQILEFGQVPRQIFTQPHPERRQVPIYPTLTVDEESSGGLPIPLQKRTISQCGNSLDGFVLKEKLTIKDCATFFTQMDDAIFVGTSSGLVYTYRLPDVTYAYTVVISNVSVTCALGIGANTLCVGCSDGKFYLLSRIQSFVYSSLIGHYDTITDIQTDNGYVFSASSDSSVKVWNVKYQSVQRIKAMDLVTEIDHEDRILKIAVSGHILVSCLSDHSAVIHNWEKMDVLHELDYSHVAASTLAIWKNKIILMGLSMTYVDIVTCEEDFTRRSDTRILAYQVLLTENAILLAEESGKVTKVDVVTGQMLGQMDAELEAPPALLFVSGNVGIMVIANKSKSFSVYKSN